MSGKLAFMAGRVTAGAELVGEIAESTVSNVAEYATGTPLKEQTVDGYLKAVAIAPVSAFVSGYSKSGTKKMVDRFEEKIEQQYKILDEGVKEAISGVIDREYESAKSEK